MTTNNADPAGVQGFQALYQVEDGSRFTLALEGVESVLLADGSTTQAYAVSLTWDDGVQRGTYYLDGAWRLVRFDNPCAEQVAGDCVRHRTWWSVAGFPSLWGIGLPRVEADLAVRQLDRAALLHLDRVQRDDELVIVVPPFDADLHSAGTLLPGTYTYSGNRLVPDEVTGMVRNGRPVPGIRLMDYSEGVRLEGVPTLPPPPPAQGPHSVGQFAPLAAPWPGLQHAWSDVLAESRTASTQFAQSLSGGCVVHLENQRTRAGGGPLLPVGEQVVAAYAVKTLRGGSEESWSVQLRQDRLNDSTQWRVERVESRSVDASCSDLSTQAGPCLDAASLYAQWNRAGFRQSLGAEVKAHYEVGNPRQYFGDGSNGTLRYRLFMIPEWVDTSTTAYAYEPHIIDVHAGRGWLLYADLNAADVPRLQHSTACAPLQNSTL